MKKVFTLTALSATALLTACANTAAPGAGPMSAAKAQSQAQHHPATAATPAAMADQMRTMQAMRDKMMNASTPAERQALMDEHMKSMQEGMATMNRMYGMKGMGNMQGMQGMSGMKDMPMMDMTKRNQMMEMRMDMMQTMMEMMMQRMPGSATPPASK